jgi:hypothetical protein
MDYQIFWKQAYLGTGSQKDSIARVTDSIQKDIQNSAGYTWNRWLDGQMLFRYTESLCCTRKMH